MNRPSPPKHPDAAEFDRLLCEHDNQKRLFGYVLSLVRNLDDAEDLFQQTLVVLWEKFTLFDRHQDFLSWACGVARFTVLNFLRARARSRLYFTDDLNSLLADTNVALGGEVFQARTEALRGCIQKLREQDRKLLLSCYGSASGVADSANASGRSIQSIHNTLCRIRRALFECIRFTLRQDAQPEAIG